MTGGEVMTWRGNGNVGIGTTTPNYPLEVVSSGNTLRARSTGSGIGVYASSETGFGVYSDADKNFMGGLTGFGQTDPTHRITVNGAIGLQQSGVTKYHINYANGGFNIVETGIADYRLFIKDGGNVGIGTSNPTSKLYVNGNAHVAGTFHADAFETDAIGRNNIRDEVGVAYASGVTATVLTTSWKTCLTKSITIPTDGYILALGSCDLDFDHAIIDASAARFTISDIPDDPNGSGGFRAGCFLGDNVGAGDYHFSISCQRLFYKTAGSHTFYLVAYSLFGENNELRGPEMALLFLPTPYGSKDGVISTGQQDNITTYASEEQSAELIEARMARSGDGAEESISEAGSSALTRQIESLTAKIEALENRLKAIENK
jgi:hypothetical protein